MQNGNRCLSVTLFFWKPIRTSLGIKVQVRLLTIPSLLMKKSKLLTCLEVLTRRWSKINFSMSWIYRKWNGRFLRILASLPKWLQERIIRLLTSQNSSSYSFVEDSQRLIAQLICSCTKWIGVNGQPSKFQKLARTFHVSEVAIVLWSIRINSTSTEARTRME